MGGGNGGNHAEASLRKAEERGTKGLAQAEAQVKTQKQREGLECTGSTKAEALQEAMFYDNEVSNLRTVLWYSDHVCYAYSW